MGFIPPFYFYTLCDATCGDVVYVRRNAAFTLHLGYVTGDMKRRESNETPHQNDRNYVHELNGLTFDSLRKNLAWWAVTRRTFKKKHHKTVKIGGVGACSGQYGICTLTLCVTTNFTESITEFFVNCVYIIFSVGNSKLIPGT